LVSSVHFHHPPPAPSNAAGEHKSPG
jgi:hypothetical protein